MVLKSKMSKGGKIVSSFVSLFILYHLAEYWIMFENNVILFFTFQFLFFVSAYFLGIWYSGNGLSAWGLPFSKKIGKNIFLGILLGIILYSVPYFLSLFLNITEIKYLPTFLEAFKEGWPFALGVLFTSFSEDILTRGLIFAHFNNKLKPLFLALFSAVIYLLNHIYRLDDGLDVIAYIFLLGILFIIPVLTTKNLWITGAMHWAGNVFYFYSHNLIQVEVNEEYFSYNYLFSVCILLMIPLFWFLTNMFNKVSSISNRIN